MSKSRLEFQPYFQEAGRICCAVNRMPEYLCNLDPAPAHRFPRRAEIRSCNAMSTSGQVELLGLVSVFSSSRIRRDPTFCVDCAKCARACPALLPVDKLLNVRSAECTACLECVAVCPAKGALQMSPPGRRILPAWALAIGIAAVFLGIVMVAKFTGGWHSHVADAIYLQLIPRAAGFIHP